MFLNNLVLDNGLSALSAVTRLSICHTEPATFANVAAYEVGYKANPTIGALAARAPSGRRRTVSAITDGTVTVTSTSSADDAQYWALSDGTNLWAAGSLAAGQLVTAGNVFTLGAFDIGIPGPA